MDKKEIETAARLFEEFTGHPAESIDVVTIPDYKTGIAVGKVLGIMYETVRDGVREKYIHEFSKKSRPVLACSFDGKQLYMIAGSYTFTDRGITDG